jgi:hypothetical protein
MNREGFENARYFHGTEVEHTPAYGLKTMFVIGLPSMLDIASKLNGAEHIYFGANQSFPKLEIDDHKNWSEWESTIKYFLDKHYYCTLDFDVSCTEGLLESGLTEYHNFIPMISVKLPYIQQLGYNATLKIDDKDFNATNPGVWCHSVHSLKDRTKFTDWSKYNKDSIV